MIKIQDLQKKYLKLRNEEGKLDEAIKLLESSVDKVETKDKVKIFMGLATLYSDTGKIGLSIKNSNKSIALARKLKDKPSEADTLRRLGWVVWTYRKEKSRAINLIKRSLAISSKFKSDSLFQKIISNAWAGLGNIYFDTNKFPQAIEAYAKGLKLAKKTKFIERVSTITSDIGNVYLKQRKYNEAEKLFLDAEKIALKSYRHELPAAYMRLGYLYLERENPNRDVKIARGYFQKTLKIALKDGWKREITEAKEALAKAK